MTNDHVPGARFWLALCGLLIIYLGVTCYRLADVPLIDPDEPRYATAGRAMAQGKSWLIPQFNETERINKPPLFYWLVGVSAIIAGSPDEPNEIAARAPSIVMGLFMLLITVYLGYKLFGAATSLLAGAILTTTPLFMVLSRTCSTDATMSALVAATLAVWLLTEVRQYSRQSAFWLTVLFLGLALLTKATPALVALAVLLVYRAMSVPREQCPKQARLIPYLLLSAMAFSGLAIHARSLDLIASGASAVAIVAVIILIFMIVKRSLEKFAGSLWFAIGLAILVGLWWYIALIIQLGPSRFWKLLDDEIWQRMTGQQHHEAMYYYIPLLFGLTFPWSMSLIGAIGSAWFSSAPSQDETRAKRADRFLLAWLAGVIFFFSIPNAKLPTYLLPAMPAMALLFARFLMRLGNPIEIIWRRVTLACAGLILLVMLSIGAIILWQKHLIPTQYYQAFEQLAMPFSILWLILCAIFAVAWWWAARGKAALATLSLLAFALIIVSFGLPAFMDNLNRRSTRQLCLQVKEQAANCDRFASVGVMDAKSLVYYLNQPIHEIRRNNTNKRQPFIFLAREELSRPEKVMLFIEDRYCARMLDISVATLNKMSDDELNARLPDNAHLLARGSDVVAIQN